MASRLKRIQRGPTRGAHKVKGFPYGLLVGMLEVGHNLEVGSEAEEAEAGADKGYSGGLLRLEKVAHNIKGT